MTVTHRVALDPKDRQETLLRQNADWARFAWNWGVAEARRALNGGEKPATSHYRSRPVFNRVKQRRAPWSAALSQNPAQYVLLDFLKRGTASGASARSSTTVSGGRRPQCFTKSRPGRSSRISADIHRFWRPVTTIPPCPDPAG